jgi:hypothetical protein
VPELAPLEPAGQVGGYEVRKAEFRPAEGPKADATVPPKRWARSANEINSGIEWLWVPLTLLKQGDTFRLPVSAPVPAVRTWRAMADPREYSEATYTEYTLLEDAKSPLALQGITPLLVGGVAPSAPQTIVVVTNLGQFLVDNSRHVEARRPGGFQFPPSPYVRKEPGPAVKSERVGLEITGLPRNWKLPELGFLAKWQAIVGLASHKQDDPRSPLTPEMQEALEQNSFLYELARHELQDLARTPKRLISSARWTAKRFVQRLVQKALKPEQSEPTNPGVTESWHFLKNPRGS